MAHIMVLKVAHQFFSPSFGVENPMPSTRQIDECSHLQLYATDSYFLGGKATYRWLLDIFWGVVFAEGFFGGSKFQPKIHESRGK